MSLENPSENPSPRFLSDDELRAELEAAEARKEADRKSKSRIVSLVLCVPTLVLLAAAGIFLLQYEPAAPPVVEKPKPVAAPPLQGAEREAEAAFDPFRPKDQRINHPEKTAPVPAPQPGGRIIDKGDLEFASRLLNFDKAADAPPVKH